MRFHKTMNPQSGDYDEIISSIKELDVRLVGANVAVSHVKHGAFATKIEVIGLEDEMHGFWCDVMIEGGDLPQDSQITRVYVSFDFTPNDWNLTKISLTY